MTRKALVGSAASGLLVLAAALIITACSTGDSSTGLTAGGAGGPGAAGSTGASGAANAVCDQVATHIQNVCGPVFGEIFAEDTRTTCEIHGMTSATVQCMLATTTCDSIANCNYSNATWVCDATNPECPPPLTCNMARARCVRCMDSSQCQNGRRCYDGECYDPNSMIFTLFPDGGM